MGLLRAGEEGEAGAGSVRSPGNRPAWQWGALAAASVSALALVGVAWSQTAQRFSAAGAQDNLCQDYALLKYALLSGSVASEGALRFRMARVARESQFASDEQQRDTLPARTTATNLEQLLRSPIATRADAVTYLRPVAVACGDTYRYYLFFEPRPEEGVTG